MLRFFVRHAKFLFLLGGEFQNILLQSISIGQVLGHGGVSRSVIGGFLYFRKPSLRDFSMLSRARIRKSRSSALVSFSGLRLSSREAVATLRTSLRQVFAWVIYAWGA